MFNKSKSVIGIQTISVNTITLTTDKLICPIIDLIINYIKKVFVISNGKIIGLTPFFIDLIKKIICEEFTCCSNYYCSSSNYYCSSSSSHCHYYCPCPSSCPSSCPSPCLKQNKLIDNQNINFNNDNYNDNDSDNDNLSLLSTDNNNEINRTQIFIENNLSNIVTNNIGQNINLINNIFYDITNNNLQIKKGTWMITTNIIITIPNNTIWTNTNLKILLANNVLPNGDINFLTPYSEKTTSTTTINYSYTMIFNNNIINNLNIYIKSEFNSESEQQPTLNNQTNYFLTKLN